MIKHEIQYDKFRFGVVDDEKIKNDTFKMRYEVYVDEFGFEKPEDHPLGLEMDDWEDQSVHMACLNENGSVVGTIRLVLNSDKGFPIYDTTKLDFIGKKPDPYKIAEISRLTVAKDLRRRKEDGYLGLESYLKEKEGGVLPDDGTIPKEMLGRKNPIIVLGLCQVMYQESRRRGLSHWYMITEDKLYYALKKYGFLFNKIGDKIWYHGWRTPYLGIIDDIEKNLVKNSPEMLKVMLTGLDKQFHPDFFDVDNF